MRKEICLTALMLFAATFCTGSEKWVDMTRGLGDSEFYSIACSTLNNDTVYMGTHGGLYVFMPDYEGWRQIFLCRGEYKGITDITIGKNGELYIATKNGLYVSSDSGGNWRRLFKGITLENNCTALALQPTEKGHRIYLGTFSGSFLSEDCGKTWKKIQGLIGKKVTSMAISKEGDFKDIYAIANNELYKIACQGDTVDRIFGSSSAESPEEETEDDGATSEDEVFCLNNIDCKNGTLYLSTNRGVFISGDRGTTWERLEVIGLSGRVTNHVLPLGPDKKDILAATEKGIFQYRSAESSWFPVYSGVESNDVRKLIMCGKRAQIWALCKNRVYKTDKAYIMLSCVEKLLTADEVLGEFYKEPTIKETQDMAINYAEVHPKKIAQWRNGAKMRALFPKVSFAIDRSSSDTYEIYTSSAQSYWLYGPKDNTEGWDINFSWDLADLVWNESQTSIDVRSKLMVQLRDDIVDEVTRIYFERRRLQIDMLMNPPEAVEDKVKKTLRLEELTAGLDGLTGGRFSDNVNKSANKR